MIMREAAERGGVVVELFRRVLGSYLVFEATGDWNFGVSWFSFEIGMESSSLRGWGLFEFDEFLELTLLYPARPGAVFYLIDFAANTFCTTD